MPRSIRISCTFRAFFIWLLKYLFVFQKSPRSALIGHTPHINYPSLRAWPPARRPSSPNRVTCSSSRLGSAICDTTPPCSAWQQTQVTPLSPYLPFHSFILRPSLSFYFSLPRNFLQLTDIEEEDVFSWTRDNNFVQCLVYVYVGGI